MRSLWSVCLLLGSLAFAQGNPPAPVPQSAGKAAGGAPSEQAVATTNPADPVITVKTPCADPAKKGQTCETIVTREQFERLTDALQPGMSLPVKVRLATRYAQVLALSQEGDKRGIDKQPKFEELIRFARMQILSQQLTVALQEEAGKVSDGDIEKYYSENTDKYQEASLLRLYVPVNRQLTAPKATGVKKTPAQEKEEAEEREKAGKAAMKKTADLLQARAAKGESFDVLEKEAYLAAGLKGKPPSTKMDKLRSNSLPASHKVAFDLKPGEVSPVISDPSGRYVYKLVSKNTLSLASVKPEIRNLIVSQRFRDAMLEYQGTSKLNETYFGITPRPQPQPGKPGSEPEEETVEPD
ncbi:MAG TPA: peptidylprolyl isomerase [Terriglobales bacterium]|nr:peptidylprolyl isomerase [Terriglobales bacterium]